MCLHENAAQCALELLDLAKSEHGRWMGQGGHDLRLKRKIELMREAARLLNECASELTEKDADNGNS